MVEQEVTFLLCHCNLSGTPLLSNTRNIPWFGFHSTQVHFELGCFTFWSFFFQGCQIISRCSSESQANTTSLCTGTQTGQEQLSDYSNLRPDVRSIYAVKFRVMPLTPVHCCRFIMVWSYIISFLSYAKMSSIVPSKLEFSTTDFFLNVIYPQNNFKNEMLRGPL